MKNLIHKLKKDIFMQTLLSILVIFFLFNMIISPAKFIEQSLDGISAWAFNVLPSVLPFMFFTRLLSSIGQMEKMTKPFSKISNFLFRSSPISIYTFLMAILSGYPVGSKMIADEYCQKQITLEEAYRMSAFCSTSGPMFIIGAVGTMMFKNTLVGYILFISHVLGAFLNGLIYRNLKIENGKIKLFSFKQKSKNSIQNHENKDNLKNETIKKASEKKGIDISEIVLSSTLSILSVGCIITIFFIIIECFSPILNLFPEGLASFLEGIIEITKGCLSLSTLPNVKLAIVLTSFVISFGGISTLLQSITMLNKVKMPLKIFTLQKLTHAILSTIITLIFINFI